MKQKKIQTFDNVCFWVFALNLDKFVPFSHFLGYSYQRAVKIVNESDRQIAKHFSEAKCG